MNVMAKINRPTRSQNQAIRTKPIQTEDKTVNKVTVSKIRTKPITEKLYTNEFKIIYTPFWGFVLIVTSLPYKTILLTSHKYQ